MIFCHFCHLCHIRSSLLLLVQTLLLPRISLPVPYLHTFTIVATQIIVTTYCLKKNLLSQRLTL